MNFANRLIVKIRHAQSPPFKFLKKLISKFLYPTVPVLPAGLKPLLRLLYEFHFMVIIFFRSLITLCYRNPLFQGRCASFGRNVTMDSLPFVNGHVEIHIGNNVHLGGKVSILSGGGYDVPKLIFKDRSGVGWGTTISVSKEIIIEEDAIVSYDCRISDTDGHRREADLRAAGVPPDIKDSRPVRIGKYAFVANGTHIMKGVTIGEGATIGANSVVITNIPPYTLAMGNPAEVLFRNYGLPSTARKSRKTAKPEPPANDQPAADAAVTE